MLTSNDQIHIMKTSTFPIAITTSIMLYAISCPGHAGISANGLVAYFDFNSDSAADTSAALGGSDSANDGSWTGTPVYKDGAFVHAAQIGGWCENDSAMRERRNRSEFLTGHHKNE